MGSKKETAIKLRTQGYSYGYIAKQTGLSKSTLSYYLSSVPCELNQEMQMFREKAKQRSLQTRKNSKLRSIKEAQLQAKSDIGVLSKRDLFILGLGIYIGEGSKTQGLIRVVNTDPKIIKVFLRWLTLFGLNKENYTVRIHLYPQSDIIAAQNFWSKEIGVPLAQFQKAYIDTRIGRKIKEGIHPNGTAHVTVRANGNKTFGVQLSRRISAWMEEVLQ